MRFLLRVLVSAAALGVATWAVPGIELLAGSGWTRVGTLLAVAAIFGLINATLKPLIKVIGCAFYVLTLGLFALVVNGLLLWLTSYIAFDRLHEPFHVTGFVAAVEGALVVAVISFIAHLVIPDDGDRR
jgi:putative membrane protein